LSTISGDEAGLETIERARILEGSFGAALFVRGLSDDKKFIVMIE
jgi:hypothetical protein